MEKNRKLIILAVMFMISAVNFGRIAESDNIRTVEFLSIFVMGALASLLVRELIVKFNDKNN